MTLMSLYFRGTQGKHMHALSASTAPFSKTKCHDWDLRTEERNTPGQSKVDIHQWSGVDCLTRSCQVYSKTSLPCSRTVSKVATLPTAGEKADSRLVNKSPDSHHKYKIPLTSFFYYVELRLNKYF